jgi:hypothetical protein
MRGVVVGEGEGEGEGGCENFYRFYGKYLTYTPKFSIYLTYTLFLCLYLTYPP